MRGSRRTTRGTLEELESFLRGAASRRGHVHPACARNARRRRRVLARPRRAAPRYRRRNPACPGSLTSRRPGEPTEHGKASRSRRALRGALHPISRSDGQSASRSCPRSRAMRAGSCRCIAGWCSARCSTEGRRAAAHRPARHIPLDPRPGSHGSASARAMAREDVCSSSYRETGAMLVRGVRMREIFLYWGGDERGIGLRGAARRAGLSDLRHDRGAGAACRRRRLRVQAAARAARRGVRARRRRTSKGDFYEAMNAAGVWQLPLVFVDRQQPVGDLGAARARRAPRRRSRRKRSPPASRASRSTATTDRGARRDARGARAKRAAAAARTSSRR